MRKRKETGMMEVLMRGNGSSSDPGASALYRPGNEIACIFENPEEAELNHSYPIMGKTGANLGLLMHICAYLGLPQFSMQHVTIINARLSKNHKPEDRYVSFMQTVLKDKKVVICFGASAFDLLEDVKSLGLPISEICVIKTVHLSGRGLNWVVKKNGKGAKEAEKIHAIAEFIVGTGLLPGMYGNLEFERMGDWKVNSKTMKRRGVLD